MQNEFKMKGATVLLMTVNKIQESLVTQRLHEREKILVLNDRGSHAELDTIANLLRDETSLYS